jgi:hypothetical protein
MNHLVSPTWLLCVGMAVVGCNRSDDETFVETAPTAAPAQATTAEAVRPAVNPTSLRESKKAEEKIAPIAQFVPPFPERLELFEPPKRAQGNIRRDDEDGETVELKGFIHVDEAKVVLSIDGVIAPVPEGGEKYGVQVISIQPPSVVLQRGRNRWTATLE